MAESPLDIARAFSLSLFTLAPALAAAHRQSFSNEGSLARSRAAGCFCCCRSFAAAEVFSWIRERDGGRTALCPVCGVDAVLGDDTGYPVTDPVWLEEMRRRWFS